jgi:hypothetical protein
MGPSLWLALGGDEPPFFTMSNSNAAGRHPRAIWMSPKPKAFSAPTLGVAPIGVSLHRHLSRTHQVLNLAGSNIQPQSPLHSTIIPSNPSRCRVPRGLPPGRWPRGMPAGLTPLEWERTTKDGSACNAVTMARIRYHPDHRAHWRRRAASHAYAVAEANEHRAIVPIYAEANHTADERIEVVAELTQSSVDSLVLPAGDDSSRYRRSHQR